MIAKKTMYKKKIKTVAIVYRPGKPEALKKAQQVSQWLQEKGIRVYSHPKRRFKVDKKAIPAIKSPGVLDLVIVLGGDGTYLEAVRILKGKKVPILGVNLGSLGFLTETPVEELYSSLNLTLDGKMEMRPRSLIRVRVQHKSRKPKEYMALNDVVIERGARSHLIYMEIHSDRQKVCNVKADGIIIASPTGSTAYNLAAQGPILHPEVSAFVVTPICPHSLTNRPIIFPDRCNLCFTLVSGPQTASLTIDGANCGELTDKHCVSVERSPSDHFVLKKPSHNYFDLLNNKLKFGVR